MHACQPTETFLLSQKRNPINRALTHQSKPREREQARNLIDVLYSRLLIFLRYGSWETEEKGREGEKGGGSWRKGKKEENGWMGRRGRWQNRTFGAMIRPRSCIIPSNPPQPSPYISPYVHSLKSRRDIPYSPHQLFVKYLRRLEMQREDRNLKSLLINPHLPPWTPFFLDRLRCSSYASHHPPPLLPALSNLYLSNLSQHPPNLIKNKTKPSSL